MPDQLDQPSGGVLTNSLKLVGEVFVAPGSSLILEGKVGPGLVHALLGVAATAFLGPVAPVARLLICANSYSKSISDQNLWQSATDVGQTPASSRGASPPASKT
jgi:hypothetical protein